MLIPLRTASLYNQSPVPNWGIIAGCLLAWAASTVGPQSWLEPMVLEGFSPTGLLGHMFLHGGVMHLAGNMLFLWVFGNVVCAKVGPLLYVPVYLLCGIAAGLCHLLVSDMPMIGASGAINGMVGFYLVLQPVNNVEMLFIFFLRGKHFSIAGFWVILYWLGWDLYGLLSGLSLGVAFTAHLGGFISGFLLGNLFVYFRLVTMDKYDNYTLPEYLGLLPKGYSAPGWQGARAVADQGTARRSAAAPSRRQSPQPRRPPADRPGLPPSKPFAERKPAGPSGLPSARMADFVCPHCQAGLEVDLGSLPVGASLSCPACQGIVHLVLE